MLGESPINVSRDTNYRKTTWLGSCESKKVTITHSALAAVIGMIGRLIHGDKALDNSVDTSAIVDDAVTTDKADFASGFSYIKESPAHG